MLTKYLTVLFVILLIHTALAVPCLANTPQSDAQSLEQVKSKVARLGIGEKAKATAVLRNGSRVKGYIAQAGDQDFVIRDRKTDAPTTILYSDVARVESNRGHSTAKTVAIASGVTAGVILTILGITIASLD